MKIKVKGLVFVGFAAAILSANAMADNNTPSGTTITSLAYTESTYQKKDTAVTHTANTAAGSATKPVYINTSGVATETTYTLGQNVPVPASGDDAKYLRGDGTWATPTGTTYSDFTGTDGTQAGAHGLVPAPATTDANKVLGSSGDWIGAFGAATAGAAGTTGLVPAPAAGDQNKVLTGGGWKALNSDISDTAVAGTGYNTGNGATTAAIRSYTQSKSDATSGTYKVGHTGTSWATLGTDGYVTIDSRNVSAPKIKLDSTKINNSGSVASNATNTATDLVTEYTLSNTINSLPSSSIPGKSSLCTASLPCALVAEGTGYHWRVMAVSNDNTIQTTAAGTLADFCDANTSCTLGNCNTAGGANVCVEQ